MFTDLYHAGGTLIVRANEREEPLLEIELPEKTLVSFECRPSREANLCFKDRTEPQSRLWRYAVLFPGKPSPEKEIAARFLLGELGVSHGLEMEEDLEFEEQDNAVGYAATFCGEPVKIHDAYLRGVPQPIHEVLSGNEEEVHWPMPDGWMAPVPEGEVSRGV
jgi:hypothetical protein